MTPDHPPSSKELLEHLLYGAEINFRERLQPGAWLEAFAAEHEILLRSVKGYDCLGPFSKACVYVRILNFHYTVDRLFDPLLPELSASWAEELAEAQTYGAKKFIASAMSFPSRLPTISQILEEGG